MADTKSPSVEATLLLRLCRKQEDTAKLKSQVDQWQNSTEMMIRLTLGVDHALLTTRLHSSVGLSPMNE